jgi:hypothetical protein
MTSMNTSFIFIKASLTFSKNVFNFSAQTIHKSSK